MKLYKLEPIKDSEHYNRHWKNEWDIVLSFIIAANNKTEARKMAQKESSNESWTWSREEEKQVNKKVWKKPDYTKCTTIAQETEYTRPKIVSRDFLRG